jgi:hypothetical protein
MCSSHLVEEVISEGKEAFGSVEEFFEQQYGNLTDPLTSQLWETISGFVRPGIDDVKKPINSLLKPIIKPIDEFADTAADMGQGLLEAGEFGAEVAGQGIGQGLGELVTEPFELAQDAVGDLSQGVLGPSAAFLAAPVEGVLGALGDYYDGGNKPVKANYPSTSARYWDDPISRKYMNFGEGKTLLTGGQGVRGGSSSRPTTVGAKNILGL